MNPHDPLPESLPDWVKEGLPPLREDEPQDLRQAIADELGDHLACAFESELGRRDGEDAETEARRAALQRFGDPKAVARRLWLDAMKERIMSQRIIVVSSAVLALTCLAISLFAFMAMRRTATVNEAILARLESLEQASKREVIPAGLSYAKFHFRAGSAKGTPVSGVEVSLRKNDEKSALSIFDSYLKRGKTGADGDLRLGPIAPDTYQYCYDAPDNSHVSFVVFGTCQTFGGYETEETVIFPSVLMADQTARLRLKLNLPEDLSGKDFYFGFYLAADFEESGRTWMCFSQYLLNGKGDIFRCKFDGKDSLDLGGVAPLESSTLALPPVKYKAGIRRLYAPGTEQPSKLREIQVSLPDPNAAGLSRDERIRRQESYMRRKLDLDASTGDHMIEPALKIEPGAERELTITLPDVEIECLREYFRVRSEASDGANSKANSNP